MSEGAACGHCLCASCKSRWWACAAASSYQPPTHLIDPAVVWCKAAWLAVLDPRHLVLHLDLLRMDRPTTTRNSSADRPTADQARHMQLKLNNSFTHAPTCKMPSCTPPKHIKLSAVPTPGACIIACSRLVLPPSALLLFGASNTDCWTTDHSDGTSVVSCCRNAANCCCCGPAAP